MAATTVGFFWHPPVRPGVILFPVWSADTERTRFWSNCIKCLRCIRNILIFWLNLAPQEGSPPTRHYDLNGRDIGYAELFEIMRRLRTRFSISRRQSASPNFPKFRSARGGSIVFQQTPRFDLKASRDPGYDVGWLP